NQKAPAAFRKARSLEFRAFLQEWTSAPASHLTKLIEEPGEGYEMLHDETSEYPAGSPVIDQIFAAYRSLRFRHQANYATHKLERTTDKPLSILAWPAAVLQQRTQFAATFCL